MPKFIPSQPSASRSQRDYIVFLLEKEEIDFQAAAHYAGIQPNLSDPYDELMTVSEASQLISYLKGEIA